MRSIVLYGEWGYGEAGPENIAQPQHTFSQA